MIHTLHELLIQQDIGIIALKKFNAIYVNLSPNFKLHKINWLTRRNETTTIEVTGGEFRIAKAGANKGKLSILVQRSSRSVMVTQEDIALLQQERTEAFFTPTYVNISADKKPTVTDMKERVKMLGEEIDANTEENMCMQMEINKLYDLIDASGTADEGIEATTPEQATL